MLPGFLRQHTELRGGKILNRGDFGNQESSGNIEVLQISVAPAYDGRCVIAGKFRKLLYCQQVIIGLHDSRQILNQKILLILSKSWSNILAELLLASGRSAVPSGFCLIEFRMYFSVLQIVYNVGGLNLVTSGLLACVRTGNETVLQKV